MCMNCTAEKWGYYIDPSDMDYYLKITAAYRKICNEDGCIFMTGRCNPCLTISLTAGVETAPKCS